MSDLDLLATEVRLTRRELSKLEGEARTIGRDGLRVQEEITKHKSDVELYEKVAGVLNSIGEERQQTAQLQIEALVSQGLRTIFGEELSFHVISSVRSKAPVTDFVIRSTYEDGRTEDTSIEDNGGGVSSVVGFLLRLVIMLLSLDKQESVIFLDETFANVSAEHGARLAEFIKEIVDKTGVQIVMVTHTHVDEFLEVADKRYLFSRGKDGLTRSREL